MSTPNDDLTEIWNNILKHQVEKDDPLWKEYVDKAAVFDVRLVDEWNKIVDVLLVYVALFISVLTSVITPSFTKLQRNPADITNDLLVAIYNQLAAQSNHTSIPPVDPRSYFNLPDTDAAVIEHALLYTSLSISTFVSIIALSAKLWLVSYSRQAFSVGSSYDRAMKRQEAYNGVLVWNMGGVINMLPVLLLVALFFFVFHVYLSIRSLPVDIGHGVKTLLTVGAIFVGFTFLGGAFVPGCPFRSAFSDAIRVPVRFLQTLSEQILCEWISTKKFRWVWIGGLSFLWIAAIAYITLVSGTWSLFLFLAGIPIAYSTQCKVTHKPQKYRIPYFSAWVFLIVSPLLALAAYYYVYPIFIPLYVTGVLVIVFAVWMCSKLSKSLANTGEIDALAWLMTTAPSQNAATFFKKAGQMTGLDESVGRHYRPRLLESLMPLLTFLITSYHVPKHETSDTLPPSSKATSRRKFTIELKMEQSDDVLNPQYHLPTLSLTEDGPVLIDEDPHLQNLEIYMSCLAQLSEFEDCKGSFWCLWEDTMQHPKLEQSLIEKLVMLAKTRPQVGAIKILNRYGLDEEGKPLTSPAPVSWSATPLSKLRRLVTLMLNRIGLDSQEALPELPGDPATRLEPVHSSEEIEEVPEERDNGDYRIC